MVSGTDGQNRLLNPASRMRARGNYDVGLKESMHALNGENARKHACFRVLFPFSAHLCM